jgi:hypothetical protein
LSADLLTPLQGVTQMRAEILQTTELLRVKICALFLRPRSQIRTQSGSLDKVEGAEREETLGFYSAFALNPFLFLL